MGKGENSMINNEYEECPECGRTMFTDLCGYCENQYNSPEEN
jgi:RNA polymerase subunit RPABC4/transcription elongation factor Spt4